jgi:serine protease Do
MNFEFNDDDFDHDSNISLFSEDSNRAMLGVTTDEDDKGARITGITHESGADKAGLKVGDVITKIGDAEIEDADDVSEAVHKHKPGEKIPITILRNGKEQKLTAELGKWKGVRINNLNAAIAPGAPMALDVEPYRNFSYSFGGGPKLGLSVQDTDDGKGVKVLDVADESSAAKAGIKKDDIITKINDDEVNGTDEVVQAMRDARDEPKVTIQVLRGGKTQNIEVRIPHNLKKADL